MDVRLAKRQVCKDVTLWPLVVDGDGLEPPEAWSLDAALEDGFVSIATDDAGAADGCSARVVSRAPVPVVVLAGEPLGAAGVARESRVVAPRGGATVELVTAAREAPCAGCVRSLARSFQALHGQVGFVLAVNDRAVALDCAWPGWLCGGRLRQRLTAWAPWLLGPESGTGPDPCELAELAPEDLLASLGAWPPVSASAPAHRIAVHPEGGAPWRPCITL